MKTNLPIEIDPEIMSGTPVFRGTRVPVQSLFEYLEDNMALDEFLAWSGATMPSKCLNTARTDSYRKSVRESPV